MNERIPYATTPKPISLHFDSEELDRVHRYSPESAMKLKLVKEDSRSLHERVENLPQKMHDKIEHIPASAHHAASKVKQAVKDPKQAKKQVKDKVKDKLDELRHGPAVTDPRSLVEGMRVYHNSRGLGSVVHVDRSDEAWRTIADWRRMHSSVVPESVTDLSFEVLISILREFKADVYDLCPVALVERLQPWLEAPSAPTAQTIRQLRPGQLQPSQPR